MSVFLVFGIYFSQFGRFFRGFNLNRTLSRLLQIFFKGCQVCLDVSLLNAQMTPKQPGHALVGVLDF